MPANEREPTGYHAHVYDADADLESLRTHAIEELPMATIGRLRAEPVGPHALPMFQIAFPPDALPVVIPWLQRNRGARSVLIHPLHGDVVREHTDDALWMGGALELRLEVFSADA